MKYYWCILLTLFCSLRLEAQNPSSLTSNFRSKKISARQPLVVLDSLSIFPNTFLIEGLPKTHYRLDPVNATLTWIQYPLSDSIWVQYRIFPYRLNQPFQHRNFEDIRNNFLYEPASIQANSKGQPEGLLELGNINYNGSIGRGLSFGNSQNAVLNSNLNLQINGIIGDSIELTAAITDNNIPIQPDGNTQDLRDFDQIYLQVRKKNWQANFGDIDIRQKKNYFLNFYKRLQGATFLTKNNLSALSSNSFQISGSVAKGKYNRNVLLPLEGNQGPYRLQGANNELFFVVLAGTERVFMDGELLVRGEDQDYTINYNTAEVSFTPKRMITKDKRIQIEFEYADRNFLNSNLFVSNDIDFNKKLQIGISVFSNQDAKNSSINQILDTRQKQFLSEVGDGIDTALYKQYELAEFAPDKILYRRVDTIDGRGIHDSIFVYSAVPVAPLYNVAFTYIGPGKGNYQLAGTSLNGKVFKWIATDMQGNKQGDWEPAILLIAPKKNQVASVTADYSLGSRSKLKTEWAVSKYDVNLFSSKNKGNDDGMAARMHWVDERAAVSIFKSKYKLHSELSYEWVQQHFRPVERLRNIEFKRDWCLPFDAPVSDEKIASIQVKASRSDQHNFLLELVNYSRSDGFNGWRPKLEGNVEGKRWKGRNAISMTAIKNSVEQAWYIRPTFDWTYTLLKKKIQMGVGYLGEHNQIRNTKTDTLSALSFGFDVWKAFVSSLSEDNKWAVTFFTRSDMLPSQKGLLRTDRSRNINLSGEFLRSEKNQFKYNLTWRSLEILNAGLSRLAPDQTLLGRLEYSVNEWNGFLNGNVLYETGAGQEQKRTYVFIEVPAGQGEFTWIDYNNNGIRELNEFEVALFTDQRNYIRIFTPTNQYVKANYVQFNYNLNITPRALLANQNNPKWLKFLARTSAISSLQINKKEIASGNFLFDPFSKLFADTALLSLTTFLSNTFFFNRTDPKWGFDVAHNINSNKSLLTYGIEEVRQRNLTFKSRVNFNRRISTVLSLKSVQQVLSTPNFANRNYRIEQWQANPSISYVKGTDFRTTISYVFSSRKNNDGFRENSVGHTFTGEAKYNTTMKGTFNARFSMSNLTYTYLPGGSATSTVGYLMLDGLLPGRNMLWNIEYTRRMGRNIEINFQYEGRKPGAASLINIGRASVRAIL